LAATLLRRFAAADAANAAMVVEQALPRLLDVATAAAEAPPAVLHACRALAQHSVRIWTLLVHGLQPRLPACPAATAAALLHMLAGATADSSEHLAPAAPALASLLAWAANAPVTSGTDAVAVWTAAQAWARALVHRLPPRYACGRVSVAAARHGTLTTGFVGILTQMNPTASKETCSSARWPRWLRPTCARCYRASLPPPR